MKTIGHVAKVQIQSHSLKQVSAQGKYYDVSGLHGMQAIEVSNAGVIGLSADQRRIDVHHPDHPQSRNRAGRNAFSVGFSGNYDELRERFGSHLDDGIAGENLVIACTQAYTLDDLAPGLAIDTEASRVVLAIGQFIEPCEEFSHYANRSTNPLPAAELKDTLQFLRNGRRGFFASLSLDEIITIRPGDTVQLLSAG